QQPAETAIRPTLGFVEEPPAVPPPEPVSDDPFTLGRTSVQFLAGHYVSTGLGPMGPSFQHVPLAARLGCTVVAPNEERIFKGSGEVLVELYAAPVTRGPGHITAGPSLLLRYNAVRPGLCVVPYIQAGAGIVYNDGYRDMTQRMFGQAQEFLLQA